MKRHLWNLVSVWRGVGLPGWVAAALALTCGVLWLGGIAPQRAETARLVEESAALEQRLADSAAHPAPTESAPQRQLAAFMQRFPSEGEMASSLGVLHAAARRQGVQLDQAEFKFSPEPAGLLARYAIVLPVKADYKALRGFIREAMRDLPGLAMEELNVRRGDAKSPVLEAQIRFVLFVARPASPPRALSTSALTSAPTPARER